MILADETADISDTEQLTIYVRYLLYDDVNKKYIICEDFLGYTSLEQLHVKFIAKPIRDV